MEKEKNWQDTGIVIRDKAKSKPYKLKIPIFFKEDFNPKHFKIYLEKYIKNKWKDADLDTLEDSINNYNLTQLQKYQLYLAIKDMDIILPSEDVINVYSKIEDFSDNIYPVIGELHDLKYKDKRLEDSELKELENIVKENPFLYSFVLEILKEQFLEFDKTLYGEQYPHLNFIATSAFVGDTRFLLSSYKNLVEKYPALNSDSVLYKLSLLINKKDVESHHKLAKIFFNQEKYEHALNHFKIAFELKPELKKSVDMPKTKLVPVKKTEKTIDDVIEEIKEEDLLYEVFEEPYKEKLVYREETLEGANITADNFVLKIKSHDIAEDNIYCVSKEGRVFAFDELGKELWRSKEKKYSGMFKAFDDGVLVFSKGKIQKLDISTGNIYWTQFINTCNFIKKENNLYLLDKSGSIYRLSYDLGIMHRKESTKYKDFGFLNNRLLAISRRFNENKVSLLDSETLLPEWSMTDSPHELSRLKEALLVDKDVLYFYDGDWHKSVYRYKFAGELVNKSWQKSLSNKCKNFQMSDDYLFCISNSRILRLDKKTGNKVLTSKEKYKNYILHDDLYVAVTEDEKNLHAGKINKDGFEFNNIFSSEKIDLIDINNDKIYLAETAVSKDKECYNFKILDLEGNLILNHNLRKKLAKYNYRSLPNNNLILLDESYIVYICPETKEVYDCIANKCNYSVSDISVKDLGENIKLYFKDSNINLRVLEL